MKRFVAQISAYVLASSLVWSSQVFAQSAGPDQRETAKPADTVSPYGVSYTSGSFTYSVPLFTIGNGEWPNQITVSLNYDSSGARYPNEPWTLSIERRLSGQYARYPIGFQGEPQEDYFNYSINVIFGNGSQTFELGGPDYDSSNFKSVSLDGTSITFIPDDPSINNLYLDQDGEFQAFGKNGEKIVFRAQVGAGDPPRNFGPPTLTLPDGKMVEYSGVTPWNGATNFSGSSSGLIIRSFGDQVCAFNAANIDPDTITSCASSSLTATINTLSYSELQYASTPLVTSVTRPDGGVYTFEYQRYYTSHSSNDGNVGSSRARYHLSCVKEPGQSTCSVQNTYDPCDGPGFDFYNPDYFGPGSDGMEDSEWTGSRDRVSSQTLADGRTISYSYTGASAGQGEGCRDINAVAMNESGAVTNIGLIEQPGTRTEERVVANVTDPLQRTVAYSWTGANPAALNLGRHHQIGSTTSPDGQQALNSYDSRGNLIETRSKPKPSSAANDIVTTATFPTSCSNLKTCNKPTTVTDAEGNTSSFTYSPDHGGVLTSVGPTVGGVSPATKYYYVQREAWLKSGSGYAKTGKPVWLLSEERSCITSALNLGDGTCAAGASDLVVKSYDYGPDSGPNNLWLRGTAVTADGETLRSCYSYDQLGRMISETQPNANLTSCP